MKQEASVLKWASLMLEQEVKNLDSIQSVTFVKRLLYQIDPDQFYQWESGKGSENYAQVLSEIEKYFKNELQTDIKQHIDRLNVYKNPMEVWELLLGIAIKGNNRGENITLILDMDHNVQAELVGIVSNIIDKFGQNAAPSNIQQIEEEPPQELEPDNNQQMFMNLVKENEELNEHIDELQAEIEKLRQDKNTILKQKKEVEKELTILKNQKTSFIEILASQNRTESRIFDDGQENVLHSPSLSDLANDLAVFVRSLKRKLGQEQQKVAILQQSLSNARIQASRWAEQNQSYLLQLGNLNAYQYEIDKMREEMNRIFDENSELIDRNNTLQEERSRLLLQLQIKAKEIEQGRAEDPYKKNDQFITVRHKKDKQLEGRGVVRQSVSSGDSRKQEQKNQIFVSEGSNGEKHHIRDELREPKLRTKLQREIEYLKKSNQSLKKQNTVLKHSNESLQKSANEFMLSNKEIVTRWEEDYQQLVSKMNEMTQYNQKTKENQQIQISQERHVAAVQKGVSFQQPVSVSHQIEPQYQPQPIESNQKENKTSQNHKESLWQQIIMQLRGIIRKGKERQFALQNTIHSLRAQNERLLGITREVEQLQQVSATKSRKSSMDVAYLNPKRSEEQQIIINVIKQGEQIHSSQDLRRMTRLSYLSIREGDDLEEEVVEKRRSEGLSGFYNMGSKIIEGITEHKLQPSEIDSNNDLYLNINRALFKSIQSNLDTWKDRELQGTVQNSQLEDKFKNQLKTIQDHYEQLNSNYQEIFRKLQLYSEQFNQAEIAKQEYHKILEQLRLVEEEVRADQEAQIVRLRVVNDHLQKGLSQAAVEKQVILEEINSIMKARQFSKERESNHYQSNYKAILGALEEMKLKYKAIMIEPQEFLSVRLEGGNEGQMEKFYKMYLKEKEKSKQLTHEIELLSAVLLQYNTILHS